MDWLTPDILALAATAVAIGFLHTLLGPDHYIPFVAMAKARRWTAARAAAVTLVCGLGHAASSVVIGVVGILLGASLSGLVELESIRLDLAAWLLLGLGLTYVVWAIKRLKRRLTHTHVHVHADGICHSHRHQHQAAHVHVHDSKNKSLAPWALFVVFVLGPCEALIPILMYPASQHNSAGVALVTGLFVVTTLATMVTLVLLGIWGVDRLRIKGLDAYSEVAAGATIALCGLAVVVGF